MGIGTLSPDVKLNISLGAGGINGTAGLKIGSLSNYPTLELGVENDYDAQIRTYGNDLNIYAGHFRYVGNPASEDHKINFFTSKNGSTNWNTPKMVLTADGSLGINTIIPRGVLDVAKFIPNGSLGTVMGRLAEGDLVGSGTFIGVTGHTTLDVDGKSFAIVHNFYGETNSSINFFRGPSRTGGFITFNTNNDIEQLRINASGNVGIGTTTPTEKLSVNGKIRAKEVKVEAINWPDYVFKPGYELPSLPTVKEYIQKNHHLPEIPSANEITKEGISLGEMNKLLVKKIEELTLYIIQLKEEQLEMKKTQEEMAEQLKKQ